MELSKYAQLVKAYADELVIGVVDFKENVFACDWYLYVHFDNVVYDYYSAKAARYSLEMYWHSKVSAEIAANLIVKDAFARVVEKYLLKGGLLIV